MHNTQSCQRGPLDDAAILREIARRIRDGMDRTAAPRPGDQGVQEAPSNDAAEVVLSRLAHELRSPISAMVSAADVMADERLGPFTIPQYRAYANDIAASGRHALAVIARALDDWRRPEEESKLDFVELDLNSLVERTVSVLQPLLRERQQTIATRLQERLPHVIADATSMRQILLNLLNNAKKYALEGCEVVVATRYALDGPVVLQVSDPGPGMSAETIARITCDQPGSSGGGLGLPLVKRLAAANGATMDITSQPGAATCVTITFAKDKVVPI